MVDLATTPPAPVALDRGKDLFFRLIRYAMRGVLYHAMWPSKVVVQDDDGTLQVQPDSKLMPGMSGVPIRLGLPGFTVKVKQGARLLLGFENGDKRKPFAGFWEPDLLDELSAVSGTKISLDSPTVELVPNGIPNARQGDMCAVGGVGMVPVPVIITLTAPFTAGPTPAPPGTPILATMVIMSPVYGSVVSGNPNVKS